MTSAPGGGTQDKRGAHNIGGIGSPDREEVWEVGKVSVIF